MLANIIRLFPLWAVLLSFVAYFQPQLFVGLKLQIIPLLMIIMLSMGLTLNFKDFKNVTQYKSAIIVAVILQFSVMPLAALGISILLGLDKSITIGMILVGSVAGGTASNVMCYIARGNVALSITMTAISTLLGVILTPLLIKVMAGQLVDISILKMVMGLFKIVLLPVLIGLLLNQFLGSMVKKVSSILPLISMIAIILVIAIVVALNAPRFASLGLVVLLAIIIHNTIGLVAGYWCCRLLGFERTICRTISFEVGLQNSGLAVALANSFFTPTTALPGAIFSIWHNISGSILAGIWSKKND